MLTSREIRQQFIDFFVQKHGHTFAPSSPVVPHGDPTLLFANAGMNQFKDVFLGTGTRPFKRAVNTQKCIRAGGKHNDLDDVGRDTYHHTFFEMLGNWSFGDYFKREAILWAWELLTEVWKLDKSRLHVTVFEGDPENGVPRDDEAIAIWRDQAGVDPTHIHLGNKKDNFWEMGDTGPCGPCTEIHIDQTPDGRAGHLVNAGSPDVIEIWNLVFIQFNRNADRSLTPLPAQHVDTGMGFERVTRVIQGKTSNYDTDVFAPLFAEIEKVTKASPYTGELTKEADIAYRVIADHARALTFALTDGATPSNEKAGYVLRSILRRASRYGWQVFGVKRPFVHALVPSVVAAYGDAFPELKVNPDKVASVIEGEELSFLRTLDKGLKLFAKAADAAKSDGTNAISGKALFDLHTEQGLFIDITTQMAQDAGLSVDKPGYDRLIEEFAVISRGTKAKTVISAVKGELPPTDDSPKYAANTLVGAKVVGWVIDNEVVTQGALESFAEAALLLDSTPFYAEQGGQVGDTGTIRTPDALFTVTDTQRLGNSVLHVGQVRGTLRVGDAVTADVNGPRAEITANHTATHLMNLALRQVLGTHVEQKGSLVDAEKTRFDFTHDKPIAPEELAMVERLVNAGVRADLPVGYALVPLDAAKQIPGVRAVFGEKYPDPVRVVMVGATEPAGVTEGMSVEFCGGTHVARTGSIGLFKFVAQEAVSKGVRRVTAVTGEKALEAAQAAQATLDEAAAALKCRGDEVPGRLSALQDEVKSLQAKLRKLAAAGAAGAVDALLAAAPEVNGVKLVIGEVDAPADALRTQGERLRQKGGDAALVLLSQDEGKVAVLVALTDGAIAKGLSASELIKPVAAAVGGGGGGKRTELAQAGGRDAAKIPEALAAARAALTAALGG